MFIMITIMRIYWGICINILILEQHVAALALTPGIKTTLIGAQRNN